jgi:hypothetical protein
MNTTLTFDRAIDALFDAATAEKLPAEMRDRLVLNFHHRLQGPAIQPQPNLCGHPAPRHWAAGWSTCPQPWGHEGDCYHTPGGA